MATDIPENFSQVTMSESATNLQLANAQARNVAVTANGVLQGAMARNFDELGVTESRATSGVIATPIAGPTTQAPA